MCICPTLPLQCDSDMYTSVCALRGIAEAVGANAGVPVEGVSMEDAFKLQIWPAWAIEVFAWNNRPSSAKAERELGWGNYKDTDMLRDIASGSYAQKA